MAGTNRLAFPILALAFWQTSSLAQARFEVASVKAVQQDSLKLPPGFPAFPGFSQALDESLRMQGGPGTEDPGRIRYSGVTMRMLVKRAYRLRSDQVSVPGWLDEQRYEIEAKVPAGSNKQQLLIMLQSLLIDRFEIQVHREKRQMPVYALTVARGGPKLKPAETPGQPGASGDLADSLSDAAAHFATHQPGSRRFNLRNASVADFIDAISPLDRPVVDKTGLQGAFGFALLYHPQSASRGMDPEVPRGPSLFEAAKSQLGLEFVSTKGDVEILVLDRVRRFPLDN
jgi:uncharacterized protein (TIGR03435 family)